MQGAALGCSGDGSRLYPAPGFGSAGRGGGLFLGWLGDCLLLDHVLVLILEGPGFGYQVTWSLFKMTQPRTGERSLELALVQRLASAANLSEIQVTTSRCTIPRPVMVREPEIRRAFGPRSGRKGNS
jgi:hypothetical protein